MPLDIYKLFWKLQYKTPNAIAGAGGNGQWFLNSLIYMGVLTSRQD